MFRRLVTLKLLLGNKQRVFTNLRLVPVNKIVQDGPLFIGHEHSRPFLRFQPQSLAGVISQEFNARIALNHWLRQHLEETLLVFSLFNQIPWLYREL